MPNYGTPPVALARGEGSTVWDVDGTPYLDLVAGIAVSSLGHAHPAVVEAVSRQVATLAHTSNLAMHEPGVRLAERLLGLLGTDGRVFLCQDGAEANEAALKLVRRHGWGLDPTGGRLRVVATEGGFHGRTFGALSVTGIPSKRAPFEPLPGPVTFVPYGDAAALAAAVDDTVAAVILETTLGEGGRRRPARGLPRGGPRGLRRASARCSSSTRCRAASVAPAPGSPRRPKGCVPTSSPWPRDSAAACRSVPASGSDRRVRSSRRATTARPSAATRSSCAAALAVLDTIETDDLLTHVKDVGERLGDRLRLASTTRCWPVTGASGCGGRWL